MKIIKTAKYIEKMSKMEPWQIPGPIEGSRIDQYNRGIYPEWMQQDREDNYFGVMKECDRCHQKVKMDPRHSICDECIDGQDVMQTIYDPSGVNNFEDLEEEWGEQEYGPINDNRKMKKRKR
jgi:hypothetical protein